MRLRHWALALAVLTAALIGDGLARADADPATDNAALQQQAAPFIAFADQIVAAVSTGQSGAFRASLSPSTLERWSAEDVDIFVDDVVMPFFADYAAPVAEQWIAPTTAPGGFTGFAFYRSFSTADGRIKPYVLFLLREDGRMVVGNLVVGKTFEDMHPQQ